jgi:hypothetical protein
VALVLGLLAFAPGKASADLTLNFDPASTFSGTSPTGNLTATFTDGTGVNAGKVILTITSHLGTNQGTQENLDPHDALYFNFNPAKTVTDLSFSLTANTGFSQASSVMEDENEFKADGVGGFYDILFTYSPSTKAFTNGESQTYLIGYTGGSISSSDFDFFSTPDQGPPLSFLGAVHVQNTGSNGQSSAFVGGSTPTAVPVPSTMALALSGLVGAGLAGLRRLRRRQAATE